MVSNCCICILFRNLYVYMSFSIACCLEVIGGSGFVMVSEFVIGVLMNILPTPPAPNIS